MTPSLKHLNKLSLLLLFCSLHPVFSQHKDVENDTIQMQELVMEKHSKKLKIKTLELKGPCYHPENMHNVGEIITIADKLPEGILESASFYFNELYSSKKQQEKFRDHEFEVVLYAANADDTPGERIAHNPLIIKVSHTFSGRLTADLSILAIESPKKLFIGLKRITPVADKDEFLIDCLCSGHDKYMTLVRKDAASAWERRWQCAALKIDVSVAVTR